MKITILSCLSSSLVQLSCASSSSIEIRSLQIQVFGSIKHEVFLLAITGLLEMM